ncbi:MAG: YdeI/OmpD-associated family protein [Paracoccaceae bacterium]|nr:YdeI/OmpD-associated family protein [Paracoccaceae bacterium]
MSDGIEQVEVTSAQALEDWLARNHAQDSGVWLVTYKKHAGDKYLSRDAVLDVLIAWGWIDGRRKKLDDDRTMQLITPRQQQVWANSYRDRAARLEAEGRMQPPGQAAIASAKAAGLWEAWQDVDELEVPEVLEQALAVRPGAADWFAKAAPSYQRNVLRYLRSAKRDNTRAKRAGQIADHAALGRKLQNY